MDSRNRENCETREYSENRECSETREYSDNAPARLRERCAEAGLGLREEPEGLTLCGNGLELRGDFTRMMPRLRRGNLQREFLVKASRIKGLGERPFAVDATAGLGEDSILLAAAGYFVRMYEHNPVIAALLRDSLRRAAEIPELKEYASRMELVEGDSTEALLKMARQALDAEASAAAQETEFHAVPDLILLDPMFPARQKSALIGKKLQLLQKLEMPCASEEALLAAALGTGARRVVVKRPLKGPYLAGKKPDYDITGKAIRYDCYVIARKAEA